MSKLYEQQEKFCRNIVEGMSQAEAYRQAGYSDNGNNAYACSSRLLKNAKIADRIRELRGIATERAEMTLERLMEMAEDVFIMATAEKAFGPAVSAVKELGVLTGLRVEKQDRTNRNLTDVEDLSEERLAELLARELAKRESGEEESSSRSNLVH